MMLFPGLSRTPESLSERTPVVNETPRQTVSTAVAEVIAERAEHLFGLMGNGNAHVISHLTRAGFPFTSARHEAATVAMADAWHRATGGVGVATRPGPGRRGGRRRTRRGCG